MIMNCSLARTTDGRIVRCGIISSCQSAATSEIAKALLVTSLTHASSATARTRPSFIRVPVTRDVHGMGFPWEPVVRAAAAAAVTSSSSSLADSTNEPRDSHGNGNENGNDLSGSGNFGKCFAKKKFPLIPNLKLNKE